MELICIPANARFDPFEIRVWLLPERHDQDWQAADTPNPDYGTLRVLNGRLSID